HSWRKEDSRLRLRLKGPKQKRPCWLTLYACRRIRWLSRTIAYSSRRQQVERSKNAGTRFASVREARDFPRYEHSSELRASRSPQGSRCAQGVQSRKYPSGCGHRTGAGFREQRRRCRFLSNTDYSAFRRNRQPAEVKTFKRNDATSRDIRY